MYYDRISGLSADNGKLVCSKCKEVLGVGIVYEKENRPAYRLFVGSTIKKIVKDGRK